MNANANTPIHIHLFRFILISSSCSKLEARREFTTADLVYLIFGHYPAQPSEGPSVEAVPEIPVSTYLVTLAVGFALAMVLLASLRERFPTARIPSPFAGMPIAMITVGLLALAFLGFSGLVD